MNGKTFKQLIAEAFASGEMDVEGAKVDFAMGLARVMEARDISKAKLAHELGVSKPLVTRILRGDANLTIQTMVRAARAAGGKLHLHVAPDGQDVQWFGLYRNGAVAAAHHAGNRAVRPDHVNPWHLAANDHETQPLAA